VALQYCNAGHDNQTMIRSFRHKGLQRLFIKSGRSSIDAKQAARISRLLDRLDSIMRPEDMALPGYGFHPLGDRRGVYAVSVSGNWRITFKFMDGDVLDVNLEDYH
jgi:proteic killer suppression protein